LSHQATCNCTTGFSSESNARKWGQHLKDYVPIQFKSLIDGEKAGFPFLMAVGLTIRGWSRSEMGKALMTTNQMHRGNEAMNTI